MKELMVSLDICTKSLTLAELSSRIGCPSSSNSHNRGDPRLSPDKNIKNKMIWPETVWRLASSARKEASLEEHLESLVAQCVPGRLSGRGVLTADCTTWITVGVLFDSANASVSLGQKALNIISAYKANLEVSCYPCESQKTRSAE